MLIRNKYIIEAIALLSYILFAMAWLGGTANMAEIMEAMQVTSLAAGSMLSGAMTTAKIIGAFIAAGVALKFGIKAAFFASAAMVGLGIVTPYSPNYEILLISRFIMGLGGALMVVYFNPIVLKFFEPKERPTVNGINAVSFNIGATIALWFMADLNTLLGGWQNTLVAFGIISLALGVAWLLVDYSEEPEAKSKANTTETSEVTQDYGYKAGLSDSFNWRYALTYAGILAFYLSLLTFSTSAGIEATKYVMGSGILGSLAGMACCQYFPKRLPLLRWPGLCITVAAVGLLFSDSSTVQTISGVAIGFFMFMAVPALVTIPHELPKMTGQRVTVIFSMFWSVSYLFSTIVLWVFGQLVDMNDGDFHSAFILVTVLSSSFFIGSFFLGEAAPSTEAEDDSLSCAETS